MDGLIHEKLNDPGLRTAVREARGFCPRHAWGLVRHGAALSAATLMRDVVHTLQQALAEAHVQGVPPVSLGAQEPFAAQPADRCAEATTAPSPQTCCPICIDEADIENDLLLSFAQGIQSDAALLGAYRASDGFCLPHYRQLLAHLSDPKDFEAMVYAQQEVWARLEQQLNELIRKSGFQYSQVTLREESDSWLRAIAATAGEGFGSGPHGDGYRQG